MTTEETITEKDTGTPMFIVELFTITRTTEDEMVGWHHRLNGHEFEQPLGVGDGQGGLVCCSPWGHKELDMSE